MERLPLLKPRSQTLYCLALSPAITVGVHWHDRSHLCCADHADCRYCGIVPRRSVIYAAARIKTSSTDQSPQTGLLERSAILYNEVCRQSGTHWHDALGRLVWAESVSGRERTCTSTRLLEEPRTDDLVSIEQLAWSVAALYRFPSFPSCSTVGQAQRSLQAFAARVQCLEFSGAKVVL